MNEQYYRRLVSGASAGLLMAILRFFLVLAEKVYLLVVTVRNFLYSKGWLKTEKVNVAVFSIGNITTGGTGKTPLVIWLCKFLQQKDIRCAILTRGYKATLKIQNPKFKMQNYGDELAILAKSCPQAKIVVNPDRVAGAAKAISQFGVEALIMDDGFQHRRLARDLDIVVIDATRPFGYGRVLPAGLLRESPTCLKRADAVVITRCDQISQAQLTQLEKRLKLINPDMIIARSVHMPICARSLQHEEISIQQLKDKKIFVFCGIGNPDAFLSTIRGLGLNLVGSKIYNDHYYYADNDVDEIYEQARHLGVDFILSTQKDWTKTALLAAAKKDIPFVYLAIELKFIAGEDKIIELIEKTIAIKSLKDVDKQRDSG